MKHIQLLHIYSIIILASFITTSVCQANAGAFTRFSVHPRAAAFGNSAVASSTGSAALTWNPAAISLEENNEWFIMGTEAYETTYLKIDTLVQTSILPISIGYLHADFGSTHHTIQNTTTSRFQTTASTSRYLAQQFSIGTSKYIKPWLLVGLAADYVKERLGNNSVSGMGLDFGLLALFNNWKFGIKADQLIQTNMKWDTATKPSEMLPIITSIGIAKTWWISRFGTTLDVKFQEHFKPSLHYGVELLPINMLAFQLGINNGDPNVGLNLRLNPIEFHLSYQNPSFKAINTIYKFGLIYRWEKKIKE